MHDLTATVRIALLFAGLMTLTAGTRADVLRIGIAEDANLLEPSAERHAGRTVRVRRLVRQAGGYLAARRDCAVPRHELGLWRRIRNR